MNALGVFTIILVCIAVGVLDLFLFGVTLMFGYFLRVFMVPKANVMLSLVVVESIYIYIYSLYSFMLKNKLAPHYAAYSRGFALGFACSLGFAASKC